MGNTIWIEVDGRPGSETHQDLGALHHLSAQLDGLARDMGVTVPSAFFDYASLLPAEDGAVPSWFDSRQGLKTVAALRRALQADTGRLRDADGQGSQRLLEELSFCEEVLVDAARSGRPFRLMVVA